MAHTSIAQGSVPRRLSLAGRLEHYSIPEPNSGCWLWLGGLFANTPYGRMSWRGRTRLAHRLSFLAFRGPIPAGLMVCHRCDNPMCINPDHLWLGTHADNMADRGMKGRAGRTLGTVHRMAKLNDADVIAIRADARTVRAIAADYGVSAAAVCRARSRKNWKHL